MKVRVLAGCWVALMAFVGLAAIAQDQKTLGIGERAPEFKLPGVVVEGQGQDRTAQVRDFELKDFADTPVLVVAFMSNQCPVATAYEERMVEFANQYRNRGVGVVFISPNEPRAKPGAPASDRVDNLDGMKIRAVKRGFPFPYLYDGDRQDVTRAFGPVATPHVYIFDKDRTLRYEGRWDNSQNIENATEQDARAAVEALLANQPVAKATTKAFGCSIKWRPGGSAAASASSAQSASAAAPSEIGPVDAAGVTDLVRNAGSGKLRLINVWATWCGPCREELPDLAAISKAYVPRGLDVVTISADQAEAREKAQGILKQHGVQSRSFIFSGTDPAKLVEALDPSWRGAIPYTVLVTPDGKVVYRKMGKFSPAELKREIESRL